MDPHRLTGPAASDADDADDWDNDDFVIPSLSVEESDLGVIWRRGLRGVRRGERKSRAA